jgi:lipid-binding SYLF domain-containing protein
MKANLMKSCRSISLALVATSSMIQSAYAGPVVDAVTGAAGFVGNTVSDTAKSVGKAVGDTTDRITGDVDYPQVRRELDATAETSLKRLFAAEPRTRELFDSAYGYAVFDNHKSSFILTSGAGAGVAIEKASGKRTYMRMRSLGANLGAGLQFYHSVFLFETERAFNSFVNSGWEATTAADATVGQAGAGAEVKFNGGMAFFNLADSGALVSVSIAGTKYWVSEDLNKKGSPHKKS